MKPIYLGINMAQKNPEIGILMGDTAKTLSVQDRDKSLVEYISELFAALNSEQENAEKENLRGILLVTGPGPFTALRNAVSTANALLLAFPKIKTHGINFFDFLKAKTLGNEPLIVLIETSSEKIAMRIFNDNSTSKSDEIVESLFEGEITDSLKALEQNKYSVTAHLGENNLSKIKKFAADKKWNINDANDAEAQMSFTDLMRAHDWDMPSHGELDVLYLHEPNITKTLNPWKK